MYVKKILTKDEEADEIIRRLSTTPAKYRTIKAVRTIDSLAAVTAEYGIDLEKELSQSLADAIDEEVMKEVISWQKNNPFTKTF